MKSTLKIGGMTCASCARSVETILTHLDGVKAANVNYANHSASVEYDESAVNERQFREAIESIGYEFIAEEVPESVLRMQRLKKSRQKFLLSLVLTLPVFIIGMFFMDMPYGEWISMVLTLPVLVFPGRHFFINAVKRARHLQANMDTLIALGTGTAFLFSAFNTIFPQWMIRHGLMPHVFFESAAVIVTLILLGKWLEERAKAGTGEALEKLAGLKVSSATRIVDGNREEIEIGQVVVGDILEVAPGGKIPVDGEVVQGNSYVNESMVTGEPVPAGKVPGDKVIGSTLNQDGTLRIRAEKVGADTLLEQIIDLVKEAQGSKAPIQNLADKISGVFVPVVMAIAALTFAIWMLIGGWEVFPEAMTAAVSVLIIACPCALGLATPTAISVGIGRGAGLGILIRDAESLESAGKVDVVLTDKTGTLTLGKPEVSRFHLREGADRQEIQNAVLSLELLSGHPLARSLSAYLQREGATEVAVEDFENISGKGIQGKIGNTLWRAGNLRFLEENNIRIPPEISKQAEELTHEGASLIFVAHGNECAGIAGLQDPLKATSADAIRQLHALGIEVHMATGDNEANAASIARAAGIDKFKAGMLPAEKEQYIRELQSRGLRVAMLGDGINDAPALARADVGIAMGTGTDIAMESAGITLVSGDLAKVPQAISLSRKTMQTIKENLFWAFFYNILMIPLAAGVLYPIWSILLHPMIAGGAMAFSSLSVVLNSLRLKLRKL